MRIEVRIKTPSGFTPREYDPDEDDVRSILMDACRAMASQGEFLISGFGQERWPVDVATDLPVFLEQLPAASLAVRGKSSTQLDFFEQGIERSVAFEPANGKYVATCWSGTEWKPDPPCEEMPSEVLEEMLSASMEAFMYALRDMSPKLANHPWIVQWIAGEGER